MAGKGSFNQFFDIEEGAVDAGTSFHSAKVKYLYDWWRAAGKGGLPSRAMFDIVEHRVIIGNVFLTEARPDGEFVFRLLGEEVIEMVGRNSTGDIVKRSGRAQYGHALDSYYRLIVETRACRRCVGSLAFAEKESRRFESIDCPLSGDGSRVDMIIGVMDMIR